MKKYNYLIVGAGLFGSVFAYQAKRIGKTCLLIEKRTHCGGNIYSEDIDGINTHKYGPHIFHTSKKNIWDFVNKFVGFNHYINSPLANHQGKLYNLPFNMNTFYQLWGVVTPQEAFNKIQEQRGIFKNIKPGNLEEQAISLVGYDIYEKLIMGYTEKQWGRKPRDLPPSIIKRLPLRFVFDNNYFDDKYQGIPIGGYNKLINGLLSDIDIQTSTDFFKEREYFEKLSDKIVFTGKIDEYFEYKYGKLEYRSLEFENKILNIKNFQGNGVINYTDIQIPYTRIIEHKHFVFGEQQNTIITYEYPVEYTENSEPYYPINDDKNQILFLKYKALADNQDKTIFGGRLAEYKYYDMHQVIESCFNKFAEINI
jgi:UDP-galactopyranose mutase